MPYSITGRYVSRRAVTRPRKTYRRSAAKKRTYRKRVTKTYRKPMTKKRILNTTSRKKRDTMLTWSNTTSTGASKATAVGPLYVAGNGYAVALWCPTARDLTLFNGNANSITQEAARTSTTCYMRGVSEKIRIQTSSGARGYGGAYALPIVALAHSTQISPETPRSTPQPTPSTVVRAWVVFSSTKMSMPWEIPKPHSSKFSSVVVLAKIGADPSLPSRQPSCRSQVG